MGESEEQSLNYDFEVQSLNLLCEEYGFEPSLGRLRLSTYSVKSRV